jgi:hypothetical protein
MAVSAKCHFAILGKQGNATESSQGLVRHSAIYPAGIATVEREDFRLICSPFWSRTICMHVVQLCHAVMMQTLDISPQAVCPHVQFKMRHEVMKLRSYHQPLTATRVTSALLGNTLQVSGADRQFYPENAPRQLGVRRVRSRGFERRVQMFTDWLCVVTT